MKLIFLDMCFDLFNLIFQWSILSSQLIFEFEVFFTIFEVDVILNVKFTVLVQLIQNFFGQFMGTGE